MTRNQLPEGVGKKIVEALKRQAEEKYSLKLEELKTQYTSATEKNKLKKLKIKCQ